MHISLVLLEMADEVNIEEATGSSRLIPIPNEKQSGPPWLVPALAFLAGTVLLSLSMSSDARSLATSSTVLSIRGATTAVNNTAQEVHSAAEEMVRAMLRENGLQPKDIVEGFFSVTPVRFQAIFLQGDITS